MKTKEGNVIVSCQVFLTLWILTIEYHCLLLFHMGSVNLTFDFQSFSGFGTVVKESSHKAVVKTELD